MREKDTGGCKRGAINKLSFFQQPVPSKRNQREWVGQKIRGEPKGEEIEKSEKEPDIKYLEDDLRRGPQ